MSARKPSTSSPLSKAEARRRVARGAAMLLSDDSENMWLQTDLQGNDIPEADAATMRAARDELVASLLRRAKHRRSTGRRSTAHDPVDDR